MPDIRQSKQYADYLSKIGWIVERINNTNYFIKKLPFLGSVMKIQRPKNIDFEEIERLRKKHRAFQTIIEPDLSSSNSTSNHNLFISHGFKLSKSYLPTRTLHLDLTETKQKLFINLKKDAKYAIKKTIKIRTKETKNIEKFRKAWKKAVGYKRYVPPLSHLNALKSSFKKNCFLYYCTSTVVQTGAIFLRTKDVTYYWQAFTNKEGRKLQLQYKIVWEGILWAKRRGCKIFDFEGIYDERFPNKSWLGFTHFKKSFGGYKVSYPGCYTKTMLPFGL